MCATKCFISDILHRVSFSKTGGPDSNRKWNYHLHDGRLLKNVLLQGALVSVDMEAGSLVLDDGTGVIEVTLLIAEIKDTREIDNIDTLDVMVHCTVTVDDDKFDMNEGEGDDEETQEEDKKRSSRCPIRLMSSKVYPIYNRNAASLWVTEVLLSHSKYS